MTLEINAEIETPSSWSNLCVTRPPWTGWFEQGGEQNEMKIDSMHLNNDGTIFGDGSDDIGEFTVTGTISDSNDVEFVKQYTGQHAVNYSGKLEGPKIAGNWEIPDNCAGTFEIQLSPEYVENWAGWFEQSDDKNDMDLNIHVDETGIFGVGSDPVGNFIVRGVYHMAIGKARFIKKYIGAHEV